MCVWGGGSTSIYIYKIRPTINQPGLLDGAPGETTVLCAGGGVSTQLSAKRRLTLIVAQTNSYCSASALSRKAKACLRTKFKLRGSEARAFGTLSAL